MNEEHQLKTEALAVLHVMTLAEADRAAAAGKLDACALELPGLARELARTLADAPNITLDHLRGILTRPHLEAEAEKLKGVPCFKAGEVADPDALQKAFERALENTRAAAFSRRLDEVGRLLEDARNPVKSRAERERAAKDAAHELMRADVEDAPLDELWETHRPDMNAKAASPKEAVMLDAKRGPWAAWFNAHLGPKAGLTPGRTLLLGGSAAAGKTSLGALLAVDAMAAGCPVLLWQLELGREETLEHLMAQRTEPPNWWQTPFEKRANRPLPDAWKDLLTLPSCADEDAAQAEVMKDALLAHAAKARRRGGHKVAGVMIVDYMQLVTMGAAGPKESQHEILATAASRLARAAADNGAVLVLLSQITKDAQRMNESRAMTGYMGADLARMAHCACNIWRAYWGPPPKGKKGNNDWYGCDANTKPTREPGKGEARLMAWTKERGIYMPGGHYPKDEHVAWYMNRALHGGEDAQPAEGF
jgi:hypothetical protein